MFITATQNIPEDAISGLNLFYPCPPTGRSATMSHDLTDKRNQASIEATTATPRNGASKTCSRPDYWIGCWLFALAAMVAVMVMIGGATRLTESGLSMVRWRPLTGWLPPRRRGMDDRFQRLSPVSGIPTDQHGHDPG